ncbi:MAG: hypothetical protein MJ231_02895, partial [bacterium]|nr:hypothetical protein [bacterium]
MIKEKQKKTKYNSVKTTSQIVLEYVKTVLLSFGVGIVITSFLAIHARSEMIKNLYAENGDRDSINKAIAEQIIKNTDLMADLPNKRYDLCIKVGDLYMTVNDYQNAEVAYNAANLKDKPEMYTADYKLICALVSQEKFDKAELILNDVKDKNEKKLLKFKSRSYMVIGDKYYSLGKFISAAKNYEKSAFYYNKFAKKDKKIVESIENRIANSYIHSADIMVNSGRNSDAVRFLKKAEKLAPNNLTTKYRLGIILSDYEPEESLNYI